MDKRKASENLQTKMAGIQSQIDEFDPKITWALAILKSIRDMNTKISHIPQSQLSSLWIF